MSELSSECVNLVRSNVFNLLFYSLIGGCFSLVGGVLLVWKPQVTKKIITPLIAFGAGAFLGAALLDILPEAIEAAAEPYDVLLATTVGFLAFFVFERLLMKYMPKMAEHSHSEHTESLPILLVVGDGLHNLFDGVVIALAYVADPALGLPTALAIAAHEVPQEIGDASVFLHLGWSKSKIIMVNVAQSLLTIPGVILGYYFGQNIAPYLPTVLGMTAGIFLYISASDLIPELHHHGSHSHFSRVVLPLLLGVVIVWQLSRLAHG